MNQSKIIITAFNGSPRKGGNTELLLGKAVAGAKDAGIDVQIFNLNDMQIRACQDCSDCDETGVCSTEDDMALIYDAIRNSNRIILASPVFFFGVSAQAKAMIDRCQCFWCEKYLLKKPLPQEPFTRKGLFLLVGGMKREIGFTCSEATAKAFFRSISVNEHQALAYDGVDKKGAILKHPTALQEAYEAGKKLAQP